MGPSWFCASQVGSIRPGSGFLPGLLVWSRVSKVVFSCPAPPQRRLSGWYFLCLVVSPNLRPFLVMAASVDENAQFNLKLCSSPPPPRSVPHPIIWPRSFFPGWGLASPRPPKGGPWSRLGLLWGINGRTLFFPERAIFPGSWARPHHGGRGRTRAGVRDLSDTREVCRRDIPGATAVSSLGHRCLRRPPKYGRAGHGPTARRREV